MSSLEKIVAPCTADISSSILGRGYPSTQMALLRLLRSMHILISPLGLRLITIGDCHSVESTGSIISSLHSDFNRLVNSDLMLNGTHLSLCFTGIQLSFNLMVCWKLVIFPRVSVNKLSNFSDGYFIVIFSSLFTTDSDEIAGGDNIT